MTTDWRKEWKPLAAIVAVFLACFYLPVGAARFDNAVREALELVKWYAREHALLCLVPAFFIAGAIGVFVSQASVMKYLGPTANKALAYAVASVSGTILAVCSCTVLPLFAGIWRMGAGLGPATAFLYSGPAINVLAIILTARILGLELGIAGTHYEDRVLGPQSGRFKDTLAAGRLLPGGALNRIILYVTALMEVKSAMGLIVAAPTHRSRRLSRAGCVPSP